MKNFTTKKKKNFTLPTLDKTWRKTINNRLRVLPQQGLPMSHTLQYVYYKKDINRKSTLVDAQRTVGKVILVRHCPIKKKKMKHRKFWVFS